MSNKFKVSFINKKNKSVAVCFEPNGTCLDVGSGKKLEIDVETADEPLMLSLEQTQDGGDVLIFWDNADCVVSFPPKSQ